MPRWCIAASLVLALGCAGDDAPADDREARPAESTTQKPEDGGASPQPAEELPLPDPEPHAGVASGFFLDSSDVDYKPQPSRVKRRAASPIDLVLRSTPPGAQAAIDGVTIGTTPTFWQGQADGIAHEFTFVKEGYAIARYRFVPTQSGVVHGTLEPLVADKPDASPSSDDSR